MKRSFRLCGATAFCLLAVANPYPASARSPQPDASSSPRFELSKDDVLVDESIQIVVSGLKPRAAVVVSLRGGPDAQWTSSATFAADANGRIDLSTMAPVKGGYKDTDPMGLFWSAERQRSPSVVATADDDADESSADQWTLTAAVDGAIVARASVRRHAVAAGVRITPLREGGMVGTFYDPPGNGKHPAVLVLSGSGGGVPPAIGPAGGLASRGYAVLALAYFGAPGLPRSLSNIPLEYFGAALRWLASQPSVDSSRIGVLGGSRGGELALLLGTVYPSLRSVVAYMPSNVVWRGCCDVTTQVAWTVGGRPVAAMPPPGRRMSFDAPRAEIQVERIHGAILLISGKDDGVWDSAPMAEKIVARLRHFEFAYPYQSLSYDHAGHGITRPYTSTMELNSRRHPLTGRTVHMGGTPAGTAHARDDSWQQMLTFVDRNLRDKS
jgi:dienelactone hydrolase